MSSIEFSLVRFSPVPEEIEAVNVAIVLWERPPRLLVEEDFPRLKCVSLNFDAQLLHFYLLDMVGRVGRTSHHEDVGMTMASSQFQLTNSRCVATAMAKNVEELLRRKYLQRASRNREEQGIRLQEYIDSRLQHFLVHEVGVPTGKLLSRASPAQFLPFELSRKYFPENGIRISRVLVGRRHVIAIDALDRAKGPIQSLETRAVRIGSAFFRLGKIRAELIKIEQKQLMRAAVLFGEAPEGLAPRIEYIEATLGRDSDQVVEAKNPPREFIDLARLAAADLF